MNEPQAFFNGQWIPASAAAVGVGDTGFVLGVTVTEQLRTFGGKLFHLDDHLGRLEHSLQIVGIRPEMTTEQCARVARELVAGNHPLLSPGDDLGLSIFVTPGAYGSYAPSGTVKPTVCMHTYPLPFRLWAEKYRTGESLVTTEVQQVSPQCWPPGLKCRSRMHYYLADRRAAEIDPGARALLLDQQGHVTEASTANILAFNSSEGLISPPPERILHGISLAVVMQLAEQLGLARAQRDLTPEAVAAADEVILTSTPLCVLPVTRFNGRPIGNGKPGAVFGRLLDAWGKLVDLDIAAQAECFVERTVVAGRS